MQNAIAIAEMLCTRLCHDMTGPIGAVNNGVEFLTEESPDQKNPAIDLICSSAHEAVVRLQFYRNAYGKVNDVGEIALTEKRELAQDFFAAGKTTLDWPDTATERGGVYLNGLQTRLLLNLLIIASASLMKGGQLAVRIVQNQAGRSFSVEATGPLLKWDPESAAVLVVGDVPLSPKNVQLHLTRALAAECGMALDVDASEQKISLSAGQKVPVLEQA